MKLITLKSSRILLPLTLTAAVLTGCVDDTPSSDGTMGGGNCTRVVTPVLSAPGGSSCLAEAIGFAYDNPTNATVYWAITNWQPGSSNLIMTCLPRTNSLPLNGYILQGHLAWKKIPLAGPPIDCATCSIPVSTINGVFNWTNTWNYVPSNVVPEILVMSVTNKTVTNSITFTCTNY